MSVDETQRVDFVSLDPATNEVVLTISDHLDWSDVGEHLLLLQAKLNSYIALVEGGGVDSAIPEREGSGRSNRPQGQVPAASGLY